MQTFKPSDPEREKLTKAAALLKAANKAFAIAKKQSDAAKAALAEWLKNERQVDVAALPIGELVNIEGVVLIEVGPTNRFDESAFLLKHPDLHAEFKRDFPRVLYKVQA